MELREYQKEFLSDILEKVKDNQRVCAQASTGFGKTIVFTNLINHLEGRILVLVDSIDLVNQTFKTFQSNDIDSGVILAGCKKIPENRVIIGMIKSVWNRRLKLPKFDYTIYDECHLWEGNKLFSFLGKSKIIGFTATPVRLKRYQISEQQTAKECMADVYDVLVCGKPIKWLIENNYLAKDENHLIDFDYSGLKTDSSGEFTSESMKKVFLNDEYKQALKYTYEKLCSGKKTMIFTSSIEANNVYKELFKDYNVMSYDSKNEVDSRNEVVNWFRESKDGILLNVNCFTKGFDVCDVEVIIVARATMSLSLYIQICGRGARTTKKIEKPNFLIIDGGNNNEIHGVFSFNRDWEKIFYDKQIKNIIEDTQDCDECGFVFPKKEKKCPKCGAEVPIKEPSEEKEMKEFVIKGQKSKPISPTIDINFHIEKGHTKYEVFKILKQKWVVFLCKFDISKENFLHHLEKGSFDERFRKFLRPIYFKIISSILKDGKNVKYNTLTDKILNEYKTKKYEI
jgi:superfamily II DNA or RNA helicase